MANRQIPVKIGAWTWVLLAGVLALIAIVIFFPWNSLRGPLGDYITEKTGRKFVIAGDLDVEYGLPPRIRLRDVRFENPDWAHDRRMLSVEEAVLAVDLGALFSGRLVFPEVRLREPSISLERSADGKRNWILAPSGAATAEAPEIRALTLDRGVIHYRDAVIDADVEIRATTEDRAERPTSITFSGTYMKRGVEGKARSDPVLNLQKTGQPFSMWIRVRMDDTVAEADGSFTDITEFSSVNARLRVKGADWSRLYPVIELPLPASPPYEIEGKFQHDGDTYVYRDFHGKVGKSDLSGDATYVFREPRPLLKARLTSGLLDLADLAPAVGKEAGGTGSGATQEKTKEKAQSSVRAATSAKPEEARRILPQYRFNLTRLRRIDAEVALKAKQFRRGATLPLEDLDTHIVLEDGVLKLAPLDFGVASGELESTITIDARHDPLRSKADIRLRRAHLNQLFPAIEKLRESTGVVGGNAKLSGTGDSVAAMLASASGEVGIAMTGGTLSNLLIEVIGLDAGEAIKFLAGHDRQTAIRCAVGGFQVKNGLATTRTLVFDTDDTLIRGEGTINLDSELADVWLRPLPKDMSIPVARSPLRVHGAFADPRVSVDRKQLAARAGAAILLGLINPLAALIPLIETGPGKDSDCAALLASVRKAREEAHAPLSRERTK